MSNGFNSFLNSLDIDPNSSPENHRLLNREEAFVLAWIAFNPKNRDYRKLIRDCRLRSLEQCQEVIQQLIDLGLLHTR